MVSIVHNVNESYMTTIRLHMYSSISNRFSITQKSILSHSKYIERRKDGLVWVYIKLRELKLTVNENVYTTVFSFAVCSCISSNRFCITISDTDQTVSIYTIIYQILCNILYTAFGQANIEYDILALDSCT